MTKTMIYGLPYENLANAIIIQACDDYRTALRRLKKHPKSTSAMDEAMQAEWFFRSAWYERLTAVDGEYLIRKLREEAGWDGSVQDNYRQ